MSSAKINSIQLNRQYATLTFNHLFWSLLISAPPQSQLHTPNHIGVMSRSNWTNWSHTLTRKQRRNLLIQNIVCSPGTVRLCSTMRREQFVNERLLYYSLDLKRDEWQMSTMRTIGMMRMMTFWLSFWQICNIFVKLFSNWLFDFSSIVCFSHRSNGHQFFSETRLDYGENGIIFRFPSSILFFLHTITSTEIWLLFSFLIRF